MRKRVSIRKLAIGGVLTAVVMLTTYAVKIPVPATGGYIHPGDGAILFAGLLLGPYAGVIGGIGSALADLFGGYAIYVLPTLIIKGIMGMIAGFFARKGHYMRNALVFTLASLIMMAGYFLVDGLMYGWAAALAALGPNALQGGAAVLIGSLLSSLPVQRFL